MVNGIAVGVKLQQRDMIMQGCHASLKMMSGTLRRKALTNRTLWQFHIHGRSFGLSGLLCRFRSMLAAVPYSFPSC